MTTGTSKKADLEKLVTAYLSRLNGQADATRLLLNMLADKVTDITTLRNYIMRHEYRDFTTKLKADKSLIIQKLSETYGLSRKEVLVIVEG